MIRDSMSDKTPRWIFLHIPKTAGSTMRTIVKKQYQAGQFVEFYDEQARLLNGSTKVPKDLTHNIQFAIGHLLFGVHRHFPEPYSYLTMLRDPVERVLSFYYYIRRISHHPLNHKATTMNIEEFMMNEELRMQTSNVQTLYLSGRKHTDLELAKESLVQYFSVAGITEMFNESLFFINKACHWKEIQYKKVNVTKDRPRKNEFPSSVIELIEKNNKNDMELYHFAKRQLEQQIHRLDEKSKEDFTAFLERMDG